MTPSLRARELVRGAFDLHVHIEPDVVRRAVTDIELARRFAALGLAGFALKSHYVPTAERASVVQAAVPGATVLGTLTLNAGVGGLNPLSVEIAAREGARIVWMPTVDAENEAAHLADSTDAKQPVWARLQEDFSALGIHSGPVKVTHNGTVVPLVRVVLDVVARHRLVLATGHIGKREIFSVVTAALEAGVQHVVVTHPDYPSQNLSPKDQQTLAAEGAMLERCFAPVHTGKVAWEQVFAGIRATGAEQNVLSTDLGQLGNPPVEDGLALMADRLLEAGFSEEDVRAMAVTNTRRLAGADDG